MQQVLRTGVWEGPDHKHLGFIAQTACVIATPLCQCLGKAATGNMDTHESRCVLVKPELQKQAVGPFAHG